MRFVIFPAASGTVGLSNIIRPLLPAGLASESIDLLSEEYKQDYIRFKIGGLDTLARSVIENNPFLKNPTEDIVLLSSCMGYLLALEIAKQMPHPPKHLILLDPNPTPFTLSRSFLMFHWQNTKTAVRAFFRYYRKTAAANFSKLPKFVRFSVYMKARYLWFYHERSVCKTTVLVCRDRTHTTNSFFSRNLTPDFHFTNLLHTELFHCEQGFKEIRFTIEKALASCK